ncbi:tetratricopeptide repeat protein [Actinophytocola xinjiangensis]|uniref:tetratricopeptide repeat protein n=1 Tax=Actinophytocola xinjiangensis TaxID=485602 RepID=UPI0013901D8B|nr:tetratricopeptide repeat protein [Actinophytocola xinjiangensis]
MEREQSRNAISGRVTGNVIQAGTIQQVVLPAHAGPDVPVPRQLPPPLPDFTGRQREMTVLDGLLSEVGDPPAKVMVAVVHGVGGAGKTTLAVQWAHRAQHRFQGGTLFVNLRGSGPSEPLDPAVVLALFLPALGTTEAQVPIEFEARIGLYRSLLAQRRVLVVLDNAANAEQVRPLLPSAPGCMAVVTGRGGLTSLVITEAARRVSLDVFTTEESEDLLRGIVGTERIDDELHAVAELLALCGGLPLAVRVAATRAAARPHVGIGDVVAEISDDGDRLEEDDGVTFAVRSVFDWTYRQLTDQQATVFRRFGLHPGGELDVDAAATLAGLTPSEAYRCLEVLADLRLVQPGTRRRYQMHDVIRNYAAHRVEIDDTPDVRRAATERTLAWYAGAAQRADGMLFPPLAGVSPAAVPPVGVETSFADRDQAQAWLRTERANLVAVTRAAATAGLHELVTALAVSCRFLTTGGRAWSALHLTATELGARSARALDDQAVEALVLSMRTDTLCRLGSWDDAEATATRTIALAEQLDDTARRISGLSGLGWVRRGQRRPEDARTVYQRVAEIARGVGQLRAEAVALCHLSAISVELGEYEIALGHAVRELDLRSQAGDQIGEAGALCDIALARQGLGQHEAAISLLRQAIESYETIGYTGADRVQAVLALAVSLEHQQDRSSELAALRAAEVLLVDLEDPRLDQVRRRLSELVADGR